MDACNYQSLGDVVRDAALACGDRAAIIFEDDEILTYRGLDQAANRVANMLRAAGTGKGDRVAILAKNHPAFAAVMFGTAKLGAAFTPINWRLAAPEISFILRDSGASTLFVDAALLTLIDLDDLSGGRVIVLDQPNGAQSYRRLIADVPAEDVCEPVARTDLAMLVYTSGTTGNPKGAMLSHGSFVRHCGLDAPDLPPWIGFTAQDVGLLVLPLFHIGSIEPLLRLLFTRATAVLHREFDPGRFLIAMERHKVTTLFLVPTALQTVLDHPRRAASDFSSVKRFYYGASPIPLGLLQRALSCIACDFIQAYGMTEMCGACVMLAPKDHLDPAAAKLRSAGRPVFDTQLRVLGADGTAVPPRAIGEIALKGSGLMTGYWNRPEATADAIGPDGWLRTGDAGYLDEDGYIYIHDRIKDMIVSGGENIYPAEVESAVYGHPDIAEVAVIGVPDTQWGEAVKAVVVAREGHEIDVQAIMAYARTRIASYKVPKSVDVVDELPKNAAGKILRRKIKAAYWSNHDRFVN